MKKQPERREWKQIKLVVGDSDELMGTSSSSSAAHQTGLLAAREELGSMREGAEETASERGNHPGRRRQRVCRLEPTLTA